MWPISYFSLTAGDIIILKITVTDFCQKEESAEYNFFLQILSKYKIIEYSELNIKM